MTADSRHIAIYLPSLRGGGAERVTVTLANGFAEKGHRVDLVLARAEGPYLADVSPSIRIVDLNHGRVLASLPALFRYLRRERPDAILSAPNHANIIAIWAHMLARKTIRLVISSHSAPSMSLRGGGKTGILRFLVYRLYRHADAVVCVSGAMREEVIGLLGLPPDKVYTIYNPLNLDNIQRVMNEPISHDWMVNREVPVLLAAGRLTKPKDYPTLLAAFALLRTRRPARLVILGQGELEGDLRQRAVQLGIAEHVHFAGFQPNPYAWMHAADLFVLSSRWEGLPTVLLEALACGANVVSTDCPTGPAEILEDGKWGRLVPVGNVDALARAMAKSLDEPKPVDGEARLQNFRLELAVSKYLEVLT